MDKKILFVFVSFWGAFFHIGHLLAQHGSPTDPWRNPPNPLLAPFYHGVASGDPESDKVIIWTRVTTDSASVDVEWRVALDTGMTQIVQSGVTSTDASRDYTVKVDVTGLQPFTFYFYEFTAYGRNSLRGRTRTTPVGSVDSLRFAVVSCSNYAAGYFNGYKRITARNDIFAIIHLGDYIYEYGDGEFGNLRPLEPASEILSLSDYRMRHSHNKLDPDLIRLHQQYPFYTVWDDHETANNAWFGGAGNHDAGEGDWFTRKGAGIQAYEEWMPLRLPDPQDTQRIYRKFEFGDLMSLYMLDTRLEARDEQDGTNNNDPNRTLIGVPQYNWLVNNMDASAAKWQVLGQQVMMAKLQALGIAFNDDQWDGYPAERTRLYNDVITRGIQNMVVLTGDIHTAWGNDLPYQNYNPNTGAGSAGVEFVCSSITSQNSPFPVGVGLIQLLNNHIKYAKLTDHGYTIMDINQQRTVGEWYYVDRIDQPSNVETLNAAWQTIDGSRHLTQANGVTQPNPALIGIQAPPDPRVEPNGIHQPFSPVVVLGIHPNPFYQFVDLQYFVDKPTDLFLSIANMSGQVVFQKKLVYTSGGTQVERVDTGALPAGAYNATITDGRSVYSQMMIKI